MRNSTKCETCIDSLKTDYGVSSNLGSDLINLKTRGFLTHPKHHLFKIILQLESSFSKFAHSFNVFEETYEDVFQNQKLSFPCEIHKVEMISNIFVKYITMRMRQYSFIINQETKKQNKSKKKLSKLVVT